MVTLLKMVLKHCLEGLKKLDRLLMGWHELLIKKEKSYLLIKQEIKYRKDLVEALDESARRENLLKAELASMKAEIDSLNARLKDTQEQKASVSNEKERLAAIVRRQAAAEAELKQMAEKRAADKLNQLKYDFSVDWQSYLKLKGGGAPADVLKSSLQRMISQFQDSGIDISQATVELSSLFK